MVDSSVEYIEKDVQAADTDDESTRNIAWEIEALLRLSVPLASILFLAAFLNSVLGRIAWENLYYPIVVSSVLIVLLASIFITELRKILQIRTARDFDVKQNAKALFAEWKKSIIFLVISVIYLFSLQYLEFFVASFFAMIVIMAVGGYRKWKYAIPATIFVLVLIYVLFVVIANLNPPGGDFPFELGVQL